MLKLWFGGRTVNRKTYLIHGFSLLGVKWVLDALVVYWISGEWMHPALYVIPAFSGRIEMIQNSGFLSAMVTSLLALPFIWIGVSMSIRRARDAGWKPWLGLLFFLPLINALMILALCLAPTRAEPEDLGQAGAARVSATLGMALQGIAAGAALGVLAMVVSVFGFGEYGSGLFVGAPFVMGVVAAYLAQRGREPSHRRGISTALLAVVLCEGALLLLALEGAICLLTAAPLAMGLATVGALVGTDWAKRRSSGGPATAALVLALPLTTAIPTTSGELPEYKAVTEVVVNAPPEVVWNHVVNFPDLPPASDWVLQTGIAVPLRARIEGSGVGAVRYCEFSTGPFVEPITVWDEPRRLGFDVVEQPPTMSEWSPYATIYAPHLEGVMQSQRGEFFLEEIAGGKTRLVGTTWYTFDMAPAPYWTFYSDFILHRIHSRVLRHVKRLSEAQHRG